MRVNLGRLVILVAKVNQGRLVILLMRAGEKEFEDASRNY